MPADWDTTPIPTASLAHFGSDPCWSPQREGLNRKKGRHQTDNCPVCGGVLSIPRGSVVYRRDEKGGRTPERIGRRNEVVSADMGHAKHVLLEDGRVVVLAQDIDPIMDSELLVHACAGCLRASWRYADRLRGTVSISNPKRLSHRAARIIGKPDGSLNVYLSVEARIQAARAAKKKMKAKRKAG